MELAVPVPTSFIALIAKSYSVPRVRPVMEIGDVVTAELGVIQVTPPSREYS